MSGSRPLNKNKGTNASRSTSLSSITISLFIAGRQSFKDELLDSLSSEILRDVQVPLRVRCDVVRRNKLSGIASQSSNGSEFCKRLAIQDQNLIFGLISHIKVLLPGIRRESEGGYCSSGLFA